MAKTIGIDLGTTNSCMEREMRQAINEVHRHYRRDLVPWRPPVDLIPKH